MTIAALLIYGLVTHPVPVRVHRHDALSIKFCQCRCSDSKLLCVDCAANSTKASHGWRHIAHGIFVECPNPSACPSQVTPWHCSDESHEHLMYTDRVLLPPGCEPSARAHSAFTSEPRPHPRSRRLHQAATHPWGTRTWFQRTRARQLYCVQFVARDSFAVVLTAASRANHWQGCQIILPPQDS